MDPEMRDDEVVGLTGRGLRGRRRARAMLVAGIVPIVLAAFLFIAAPDFGGGPWTGPPSLWTWIVPRIGGATGAVIGIAWMLVIERRARRPEEHRSSWRSLR